ncbi:hypothetical protein LTR53_001197 [Teratosphaeriaceae sp. CCFEE 6253]|nr:hypothetical protein LTR53_001197 [Teratosphaeriaceae sp. CCFEE 6253]
MLDSLDCANKSAVLGGIEIYSQKAALSRQLHHPEFLRYHDAVAREGLYAQDEKMQAWYPRLGFLARDGLASTGLMVVTAMLTAKDDAGSTSAMAILGSFAAWVKAEEPTTLTYAVLTRPKAPKEILMFERYADPEALGSHMYSKRYQAML